MTASVKSPPDAAPVSLSAPEAGKPMTADGGWSLSGTEKSIKLTQPGQARTGVRQVTRPFDTIPSSPRPCAGVHFSSLTDIAPLVQALSPGGPRHKAGVPEKLIQALHFRPVPRHPRPMATIAIYSLKGGVGKTTLAVNLAWAAAVQSARRTLLWDLDPQAASTFLLTTRKPKGDARSDFLA